MSDETKENKIRFGSLHVYRRFDGSIRGSMEIESDDASSVKITLPAAALESLIDMVAENLAEAAAIQADRLRDAILSRPKGQEEGVEL